MKLFGRYGSFGNKSQFLFESFLCGALGSSFILTSPITFAAQTEKSDLNEIARWRTSTDAGKKYVAQGRLDEAEIKFSIALEASIVGFGSDAPHVAMSCNNLAEVFRVQAKLDPAIDLYQQAVELFLKHYGLEDPRTATAYYNLASALYLEERYVEAYEAAEKGFEGMKGAFGSERNETLSIAITLAKCEWKLKKRKKALSRFMECQEILQKKDERSMESAQVAGETVLMMLEMDQKNKALSLVEFICGCFAECKKEQAFKMRQLMDRLVDGLVESEMYQEAMKIAEQTEKSLKSLRHQETLSLAAAMRKQALVQIRQTKESLEDGVLFALASFDMVHRLFVKIPANGGGNRWIPAFVAAWIDAEKTDEEMYMHRNLVLNCIFDLAQDAMLLCEYLKKAECISEDSKGKIRDSLQLFLVIMTMDSIKQAVEELEPHKKFANLCETILKWKEVIENNLKSDQD